MDGYTIFKSEVWRRLFQINEPNYKELILEFFSTYTFKQNTDFADKSTMQFCLGGKQRSLSLIQFARILDIYPSEVVNNNGFSTILANTHITILDEKILKDWWITISQHEYVTRASSMSDIKDPIIKFFHHLLIHTFSSRKDISMKVTKEDLMLLYCIINRLHVNVAFWIAKYLTNVIKDIVNYPITGGGQYITRIARYFGILKSETVQNLTKLEPRTILDKDYWITVDLCRENVNGNLEWIPRYDFNYSTLLVQEHEQIIAEMEQGEKDIALQNIEQEEAIAIQESQAEEQFQNSNVDWMTSMFSESNPQPGAYQNSTMEERITILELEVQNFKTEIEAVKKLIKKNEEKQIQEGWGIILNKSRIVEQSKLQEVMNLQMEWIRRRFEQIIPPEDLFRDPWPTVFQQYQPLNPPQ